MPIARFSSTGLCDRSTLELVLFGGCYIASSACLINFNKWLLNEDRFPYPLYLVLYHSILTTLLALILFLFSPSLFPSVTRAGPATALVTRRWMLWSGMPIAFFFSAQLVLSNTSYMHSSVAFLQMMKESNMVFVYILSLLFALEVFSLSSVQVLVALFAATLMTVHGELSFSAIGFRIQATSQVFESIKVTLQGYLLSGEGKMDAMSYALLIMPLCGMLLSFALVVLEVLNRFVPELLGMHLQLPAAGRIHQWWPQLLLNGAVAFMLNVVTALFLRRGSPVAFVMAGMLKDMCIVLTSVFLMSEKISRMQACGFALQLLLILAYAVVKRHPERFHAGVLKGCVGAVRDGSLDPPKTAAQEKEEGRAQPDGSPQKTYGSVPVTQGGV